MLALTQPTSSFFSSFSISHLTVIIAARLACSSMLNTPHLKTSFNLLGYCIAIYQAIETMTDQFIEDGWSEQFPKLCYQCQGISNFCSSILSHLHKSVMIIFYHHRALVRSLELISYRLAMVSIEVIFLEQSLKYIPCHRLDVKIIPDSLPPSQCNSGKLGYRKGPEAQLVCPTRIRYS